jgi:hypothetical protein
LSDAFDGSGVEVLLRVGVSFWLVSSSEDSKRFSLSLPFSLSLSLSDGYSLVIGGFLRPGSAAGAFFALFAAGFFIL